MASLLHGVNRFFKKRQQFEINRYPQAAQILNKINANVMHKMHALHPAPAKGTSPKIEK
jgi:hypothetical protein